jgi:sialic acid synthase SpsE
LGALRLDCCGLSHPVAELATTAEEYRAVATGATSIEQHMTYRKEDDEAKDVTF